MDSCQLEKKRDVVEANISWFVDESRKIRTGTSPA